MDGGGNTVTSADIYDVCSYCAFKLNSQSDYRTSGTTCVNHGIFNNHVSSGPIDLLNFVPPEPEMLAVVNNSK